MALESETLDSIPSPGRPGQATPPGLKVLVAGAAGYVGQVLTRRLLASGHRVTAFDNLAHGCLPADDITAHPNFSFVKGDVRDVSLVSRSVLGHQAVVLLASLVGEAACDQDPESALEINYLASLNIFEAAIRRGVNRFVFASTDSCYGNREGEKLSENSPLAPLSLYAKLKADVEARLMSRTPSPGFSPTVLRLATVYGLSPRMRFDLAVNLLVRESTLKGKARIFSGEQWRPLVHVSDVARAFELVLSAPPSLVSRQVFNVGSNQQNIQFKDLGVLLSHLNPDSLLEYIPTAPDLRDYYVKFDKIHDILSYKPNMSLYDGMTEIKTALKNGIPSDPYDRRWRNA